LLAACTKSLQHKELNEEDYKRINPRDN